MAKNKTTTPSSPSTRAPLRERNGYEQLHALLHTVRSIAHFEDALCELTHELKSSSALSPASREELAAILARLPSHEYLDDLETAKTRLLAARTPTDQTSKKRTHKRSA